MVKSKEENKECKEMKDKKNKGYKEPKDPLTEKSPRHQAAALSKDIISDEVAISPAENDKIEKEETTSQALEAISNDVEKVPDKDREQIEETVTLRFEDTDEFLDALKEFEKENNLELAMDFDTDSYIVGVPIGMVDAFRKFMDENDIKEITDKEIDERIAEVQKGRSGLALAIDKSMTASRVVSKENANEWLKHPNRLDLDGVDTKAEEE